MWDLPMTPSFFFAPSFTSSVWACHAISNAPGIPSTMSTRGQWGEGWIHARRGGRRRGEICDAQPNSLVVGGTDSGDFFFLPHCRSTTFSWAPSWLRSRFRSPYDGWGGNDTATDVTPVPLESAAANGGPSWSGPFCELDVVHSAMNGSDSEYYWAKRRQYRDVILM